MQANELGFDPSAVAACAESLGHSAHLVQFYESDAFLADTVARFVLVKPIDPNALQSVARLGGDATRNGTRPH